jgi:hypothetical protein
MQEHPSDIDSLLSDAGDFIETRTTLWKYKGIESLADVSGELVAGLALIVFVSFVVILFSIGLALLLGDWIGKSYYGFFIVGGAYSFAALIVYARREKWLKDPFSNMLIRKILK